MATKSETDGRGPGHLLTPQPVGAMPDNVKRWDDDRIELRLSDADYFAHQDQGHGYDDTVTVTDQLTGARFVIRRADCGLGCHCAAEAQWIAAPAVLAERMRTHSAAAKSQANARSADQTKGS